MRTLLWYLPALLLILIPGFIPDRHPGAPPWLYWLIKHKSLFEMLAFWSIILTLLARYVFSPSTPPLPAYVKTSTRLLRSLDTTTRTICLLFGILFSSVTIAILPDSAAIFFLFLGIVLCAIAIRPHKPIPPPTPGICPTCGYDLRATPTRCPECGTPAPTQS